MRKVKSNASGAQKLFDMERTEIDQGVKELLYDEKENKIAFPEDEAFLLQLPGTLPFAEIKPHS